MYQPSIKLLKRIGIALIILICLGVVYFIATHGSLKIVSGKPIANIIINNASNQSDRFSTTDDNHFLPSHTYGVSVTLEDGSSYTTQVLVKGWLQTTTVDVASSTEYRVEKLATNSLSHLVAKGASLYTHRDSTGPLAKLDLTNPFADNQHIDALDGPLSSVVSLASGHILALRAIDVDSEKNRQLVIIDPESNLTTVVASELTDSKKLYKSSGQSVTLFDTSDQSLTRYTFQPSGALANTNRLGTINEKPVAKEQDQPIIDISEGGYAVAIGSDNADHSDDESAAKTKTSVVIYDNNGKKKSEAVIPDNAPTIRSLNLSPDGSRLCVLIGDETRTFDTGSGNQLFSIPLALTNYLWSENNVVYAKTTLGGIYRLSIDRQVAQSVLGGKDLNITALSYIDGSYIYFTGFSTHTTSQTNPDAYRLDLKKPAEDIDKKILAALPYETPEYSINVIGSTIFIKPVVLLGSSGVASSMDTSGSADQAKKYLADRLPGIEKTYRIVVVN